MSLPSDQTGQVKVHLTRGLSSFMAFWRVMVLNLATESSMNPFDSPGWRRRRSGRARGVLDRIVLQKILPRLHGSRRRLERRFLRSRGSAAICPSSVEADERCRPFAFEDAIEISREVAGFVRRALPDATKPSRKSVREFYGVTVACQRSLKPECRCGPRDRERVARICGLQCCRTRRHDGVAPLLGRAGRTLQRLLRFRNSDPRRPGVRVRMGGVIRPRPELITHPGGDISV